MFLPLPLTSHILILPSSPADSSRCPVSGKKRIALTPCAAQEPVDTELVQGLMTGCLRHTAPLL